MRSLHIECHPDSAIAQQKDSFTSAIAKTFAKGVALAAGIVVGGIVLAISLILLVLKFLFKRPTKNNPK